MRLLLDQGVSRSTVESLAEHGIDASHVGSLGMASATDAEILEHAAEHGLVVVSLDSDFHSLLARSAVSAPSVIRVRIEGLKSGAMADVLTRVVTKVADALDRGCVASVTEKSVRVRLLPISAKPR